MKPLRIFDKIKLFTGIKMPESLPVNWQQNYPWFNFEIIKPGNYILNNKTGYSIDEFMSPEARKECFKTFNRRNIEEGGTAIKRIAMVSCSNSAGYDFYKFTNGWIPVQDSHNNEANINTACLIEYNDGTNTGWLKWSSNKTIKGSLSEINILLFLLANSNNHHCRICAREARSQYIASLIR